MRLKALFLFAVLLFSQLCASAGYAGGIEGDAKALRSVEMMLDSVGGRQVWAQARSLYTMERARHPVYGDGIMASFWRDLDQPGESARLVNENMDVSYAWTATDGWLSVDGVPRDYSPEELAERGRNWHQEIYTLYHQLALGKRSLTVKFKEPNGFTVFDENKNELAEFLLTPKGHLYYWAQSGGKAPVAYVYGPHKDFGQVNFPDWGSSTDGGWSFYYVQVKPSNKTFSHHVDLTRPDTEWHGGALIKHHCTEDFP